MDASDYQHTEAHSHPLMDDDHLWGIESTAGTRQKRRRTSPQDHAVLEAAYQKNCKPDKKERAEIVSRVSLGEKEVQIWFQNRRQNDRRRSRPLQPHELIPHLRNSITAGTQIHAPTAQVITCETLSLESRVQNATEKTSTLAEEPNNNEQENTHSSDASARSSTASSDRGADGTPTSSVDQTGVTEFSTTISPAEYSGQTSTGKKRSYSDMRSVSRLEGGLENGLHKTPTVRLSITADGAVKVKTTLGDTPSPPKHRPQPLLWSSTVKPERRSAPEGEQADQMRQRQSRAAAPCSTFGRSRDVRTWEFYCDSGARDSLSLHAEAETKGSATSAIALIRSQSQKPIHSPLSNRPNRKNAKSGTPTATAGAKSKFYRVKSSVDRFDGARDRSTSTDKKMLGEDGASPTSGDSDKENWAPGTHSSINPLRRTEPSSERPGGLREHEGLEAARRDKLIQHHHLPRLAFKSAEETRYEDRYINTVRNKGEEELCVQGLLSLSQGAWR